MEMTKEELEDLEGAYNSYYAEYLRCEDITDKYYYRGEFMGVNFALGVLGYTGMRDGTTVKFRSDSGKSMECDHYKIIKDPRRNKERKKMED